MEKNDLILGKGLAFPLTLSGGAAEYSSYEALIESSIKNIIFWDLGTRWFLPNYGARLYQLLGERNHPILHALVKRFIIDALNSFEQRIVLLEVALTVPNYDILDVAIKYKIKANQEVKNTNFQYRL